MNPFYELHELKIDDIGALTLLAAHGELGVAEDPPGSNTGPRVREYLAPCVRDVDRDGDLERLGLTEGEWCAAFASWCVREARRAYPGTTDPPRAPELPYYRASGIELQRDARDLGRWHPVDDFQDGLWSPWCGDLVVFRRGKPDPNSWKRHIGVFSHWETPDWSEFWCIEGNVRHQVRWVQHHVNFIEVLGFVDLHQRLDPRP